MADDKITLRCAHCGSEQFEFPSSSPDPDDVIVCAGCGARGRYADIQAEALKLATKHIQNAVRQVFKGSKHFKLR